MVRYSFNRDRFVKGTRYLVEKVFFIVGLGKPFIYRFFKNFAMP